MGGVGLPLVLVFGGIGLPQGLDFCAEYYAMFQTLPNVYDLILFMFLLL